MMKKIYYTYKIVNKMNGKYYLGMHMQNHGKIDSYYGSGILIKKAISKYGKDNFDKIVLQYFNTIEEMKTGECKLITQYDINNDQCYNMKGGGDGGSNGHSEYTKKKISISKTGVSIGSHSDSTKNKISIANKNCSSVTRKKLSDNALNRSVSHKDKLNNARYGRKLIDIECPHCKKKGQPGGMKRWHFGNCKYA